MVVSEIVSPFFTTSAMVLAWTMLNATPNVKISRMAKSTPPRREPRPRWM